LTQEKLLITKVIDMSIWASLSKKYKYDSVEKLKLTIGIPTINQADLLEESLQDISKNMGDVQEVIIVDNGNQNFNIPNNLKDKTHIHKPGKNLGVSASWNYIINKFASTGGHLAILNDDIIWGKSLSQVQSVLDEVGDYNVLTMGACWSCFFISKECINKIGLFDTKFYPAYFEDNDYAYRLKLNDTEHSNIKGLDPLVYRKSMTIKKDPNLNKDFSSNRRYFIQK